MKGSDAKHFKSLGAEMKEIRVHSYTRYEVKASECLYLVELRVVLNMPVLLIHV